MAKINENSIKDFSIVTYEPLREEDIIDLGITRWAFIKHDKDLKEDGTPKEIHYHYYIKIPNRKRISTLSNYFKKNRESNVMIQECKSPNAIIRYFIHQDEENKAQYTKEEIYSNFDITSAFEPSQDIQDILLEIITKIINQEIKTFTECVQYAIQKGSLETITKNAYFIRTLIQGR